MKKIRLKDGKKRTLSQQHWLQRQLGDPYVSLARKEGYRSRAAYKLLELNKKYDFLKPGQTVVDLGAAPGGWSQVVGQIQKGQGRIFALDISPIEPLPHGVFIQGDFTSLEVENQLKEAIGDSLVDVVLSDMAAPACGIPSVDHLRIMSLLELACSFAQSHLTEGGVFVGKVLRGGSEQELLTQMKKTFEKVHHFKPPSSRQDSSEMFVIARGFRKQSNT